MVPTYDQVREALRDSALDGVPPGPPWSVLLEIGDLRVAVRVDDGAVTAVERVHVRADAAIEAGCDFGFTISASEWADLCAVPPPRGCTSAQALVATRGDQRVSGRREVWARAALALDRMVGAVRDRVRAAPPPRPGPPGRAAGLSPIEGRYLHVDVRGEPRRIFLEQAGTGVPLVCLHTAGADARQFRYLLEDPRVTDHHRVIAFDMPWHGRSDPPADWQRRRYTLDTETYAATVLAVLDALELRHPILLGCSMGGAIALYLASRYGERFTGVCALEGGLGNPGRFVEWTNRADVDHSAFLVSWVGGLIAPASPAATRAATLWGYAQSGPGVYQGDTYFYSVDLPRLATGLEKAGCPLVVFSGEYDYSATTEMSRAAAERLGGRLVEMPGRGHFPMSEDPESMAAYLLPVLAELRSRDR